MNPKVRGTTKSGSIRASKSKINKLRKEWIKELNEKNKIKELRRKTIKELKDLIYKQNEKRKSYNICRRINRLGLSKISKRKNLSNKDAEEIKELNGLTTEKLKIIVIWLEKNLRSEKAPQEDNDLDYYLDNATSSE